MKTIIKVSAAVFVLTACAKAPVLDPPALMPESKESVFNGVIADLGVMAEIYGAPSTKIFVLNAGDDISNDFNISTTGLQHDITSIVTTALNGMGKKVELIPYYAASVISATESTKLRPKEAAPEVANVLLAGGITESDAGKEILKRGMDAKVTGSFEGMEAGASLGYQTQSMESSITVDFNLFDFEKNTSLPGMQANNTIEIYRTDEDKNVGFTLFNTSFGLQGNIRKYQPRHAAVRLLTQLSMIQIVGRYFNLPYWTLLKPIDPKTKRDDLVVNRLSDNFHSMGEAERIAETQKYLFLGGYGDIVVSGEMDGPTRAALQKFSRSGNLDFDTYLAVYEAVPVTRTNIQRRAQLRRANLAASRDGSLRLWTDKAAYRYGEPLAVHFAAEKPLCAALAYVTAAGQSTPLFPDNPQQKNRLKAGTEYRLPPFGDSAELVVDTVGADTVAATVVDCASGAVMEQVGLTVNNSR